jgi:hypothetical protein
MENIEMSSVLCLESSKIYKQHQKLSRRPNTVRSSAISDARMLLVSKFSETVFARGRLVGN